MKVDHIFYIVRKIIIGNPVISTTIIMKIGTAKALSKEEILKRLDATESGLSDEEATRRLARYGPNVLEERRSSPGINFLGYFWRPNPWMIEFAAILFVIHRQGANFHLLVVLLMVNAGGGFYEEY